MTRSAMSAQKLADLPADLLRQCTSLGFIFPFSPPHIVQKRPSTFRHPTVTSFFGTIWRTWISSQARYLYHSIIGCYGWCGAWDDDSTHAPTAAEKSKAVASFQASKDANASTSVSLLDEASNNGAVDCDSLVKTQDKEGRKLLNQYRRERVLGHGSYAKVVLYRDTQSDELYAIKVCHKERLARIRVAPKQTALMDVRREVSILKQLHHPSIVRLHQVIDDPSDEKLYLVLQYLPGGPVSEGTGPPGGIPPAQARNYFGDVLTGLIYLHSQNVVHGDIKPENLLMSAEGRVVISDFGVSHKLQRNGELLQRSPGTPVYCAPECCRGEPYSGQVADIWALGCTLYVWLTGTYPFVGTSLDDTYEKIINSPLVIPPSVDSEAASLLEGLLAKDACRRMSLREAHDHPWMTSGKSLSRVR